MLASIISSKRRWSEMLAFSIDYYGMIFRATQSVELFCAYLLSLGISKLEIFGQFLIEMVFISIPAFVGSYFLAQYTADKLGNNILNKVTGDIAKQIARQSASSQLGGGAEAEGFNKTLSSLDINVLPKFIIYVVIFMSLVLLVSLIISSFNILRKNPKELLIDNN